MEVANVLICLIGKSPQILTESLYFLVVRHQVRIDKLIIITTSESISEIKDAITKNLEIFKVSNKLKYDWQLDYQYASEEIYERQEESSLTKLIFEIVQSEKIKGSNLHCIISGGRKTMSVDLAIALSIFGGIQDKMYHIVASDKFVKSGKYFPETEEESRELVFFEKPFVRLKAVEPREKFDGISSLVSEVQNSIDSRLDLPELKIYAQDRAIEVNGTRIGMQPLPFSVYYFFARIAGTFIRGGKMFSDENAKEIWNYYKEFSQAYGQFQRVKSGLWIEGQINFELVQKSISIIRKQLNDSIQNTALSDFYLINTIGNYADKHYGIKLNKSRVKFYNFL